jgi:hypothetical protein
MTHGTFRDVARDHSCQLVAQKCQKQVLLILSKRGDGFPDAGRAKVREADETERPPQAVELNLEVVRPARIELAAPRLGGGCSIR